VASGTIFRLDGTVLSHFDELLSCAEAWPYRTLSYLTPARMSDSEHELETRPIPLRGLVIGTALCEGTSPSG
jgi:hypothetical protein